MSIHGVCFDEGMSGNCGLECRAHEEYECKILDEVLDNHSFNEIYDNGNFDDYLIDKFIPVLVQEVIEQQTAREHTIQDHLKKLRMKNE